MLRLLIFAIIASTLGVVIRCTAKELFVPFSVCAAIIFTFYILSETELFITRFINTVETMPVRSDVLKTILKAAAVTVITKLSCDVCHESGNYLVEDIIELGGKIMIFVVSLPFITDVLEIAVSFVK